MPLKLYARGCIITSEGGIKKTRRRDKFRGGPAMERIEFERLGVSLKGEVHFENSLHFGLERADFYRNDARSVKQHQRPSANYQQLTHFFSPFFQN